MIPPLASLSSPSPPRGGIVRSSIPVTSRSARGGSPVCVEWSPSLDYVVCERWRGRGVLGTSAPPPASRRLHPRFGRSCSSGTLPHRGRPRRTLNTPSRAGDPLGRVAAIIQADRSLDTNEIVHGRLAGVPAERPSLSFHQPDESLQHHSDDNLGLGPSCATSLGYPVRQSTCHAVSCSPRVLRSPNNSVDHSDSPPTPSLAAPSSRDRVCARGARLRCLPPAPRRSRAATGALAPVWRSRELHTVPPSRPVWLWLPVQWSRPRGSPVVRGFVATGEARRPRRRRRLLAWANVAPRVGRLVSRRIWAPREELPPARLLQHESAARADLELCAFPPARCR